MLPFRLRHADRIVGAFLLLVVLGIAAALILVFKSQDLFVRRVEFNTVFDDGSGISPGTSVKIAGIEVGKVRHVRLSDENKVEVVFDVLESYVDRLRADVPDVACDAADHKDACGSRIAVNVPAGLGAFLPAGGLVITVGNMKNPAVPPGGTVPSVKPEGLQELLARLQNEGVVQNAKEIVEQITVLLRRINDEKGPIWRTVEHVEAVTARARAGKGIVGEALAPNSPLQATVQESLQKIERTLADLEKSTANVTDIIDGVHAREDQIHHVIDAVEGFSRDLSAFGANMNTLATDAQKIPPDVREAVANLNRRIDDLGEILQGLKRSFPFNMVVETPKDAAHKEPAPTSPTGR